MAPKKYNLKAADLKDPSFYTENYLRFYSVAPENAIESGLAWYREANRYARGFASLYGKYGITPEIAAAVISALSPFVYWEQNVKSAWTLLHGMLIDRLPCQDIVGVAGWRKNRKRAARVISELNPEVVYTSPKTRNFCKAIANPKDTSLCVIDFWMIRAGLGLLEFAVYPGLNGKRYGAFEDGLRHAARVVNLPPLHFQAVIWITIKSIFEYKYTDVNWQ